MVVGVSVHACVHVCVCVCEREREREKQAGQVVELHIGINVALFNCKEGKTKQAKPPKFLQWSELGCLSVHGTDTQNVIKAFCVLFK